MSIQWPAIVSLKGVDELLFVGSLNLWESDAEFNPARFQPGDRLIDTSGGVYSLGGLKPIADNVLSHEQVLELVRQHASVCGQCCVSKMGAPSIRDAIQMVQHIE